MPADPLAAMPARWRETFLAWSREPGYVQRIAAARRHMMTVGQRYRLPAVAFSGGKDSTVLLHLAAGALPAFLVTHFDFGRPGQKRYNSFPAALEHEILANARAIGARPVHVVTKPKYWQSAPDYPEGTLVHYLPDDTPWHIGSMVVARGLGADVSLVGLRKAESVARRHRINAGRALAAEVLPEAWPVAELTSMDVWAYIVQQELPYPSFYDGRAAVVGSYLDVRLTSLYRDPAEARVDSGALDGVLHWRARNARR